MREADRLALASSGARLAFDRCSGRQGRHQIDSSPLLVPSRILNLFMYVNVEAFPYSICQWIDGASSIYGGKRKKELTSGDTR